MGKSSRYKFEWALPAARQWLATFLEPQREFRLPPLAVSFIWQHGFRRWPSRTQSLRIQRPSNPPVARSRSEEHTSELQSLMRISYAVFCLKKKIKTNFTA